MNFFKASFSPIIGNGGAPNWLFDIMINLKLILVNLNLMDFEMNVNWFLDGEH